MTLLHGVIKEEPMRTISAASIVAGLLLMGLGCTATVRDLGSPAEETPPPAPADRAEPPATNSEVETPPPIAPPEQKLSGVVVGGGVASGGAYQLQGLFHYTVATRVATGGDYALSAPALALPMPAGGQ